MLTVCLTLESTLQVWSLIFSPSHTHLRPADVQDLPSTPPSFLILIFPIPFQTYLSEAAKVILLKLKEYDLSMWTYYLLSALKIKLFLYILEDLIWPDPYLSLQWPLQPVCHFHSISTDHTRHLQLFFTLENFTV